MREQRVPVRNVRSDLERVAEADKRGSVSSLQDAGDADGLVDLSVGRTGRVPKHVTDHERFWSKVDSSDPAGCWIWLGSLSEDGYGGFYCRGRFAAHRWAYETYVGPIPDGHEIDHIRRTRACVRMSHLRPLTHQQNVLVGDTIAGNYARRTHCNRGHAFTPENTRQRSDGGRRCKECRK